MKKIIFILVLSLFTSFSLQLSAQIEEEEDEYVATQIWLDYTARYDLKNNFTIYGDTGWRIITPHHWTRYYLYMKWIPPVLPVTISNFTNTLHL